MTEDNKAPTPKWLEPDADNDVKQQDAARTVRMYMHRGRSGHTPATAAAAIRRVFGNKESKQ
jgi:hypothetical protein